MFCRLLLAASGRGDFRFACVEACYAQIWQANNHDGASADVARVNVQVFNNHYKSPVADTSTHRQFLYYREKRQTTLVTTRGLKVSAEIIRFAMLTISSFAVLYRLCSVYMLEVK